MIEANPRASRTVPFVSKAIGAPLAKIACRLMLGEPLHAIELPTMHNGHVSVKEAVLPFARFAGADSVLGPEMKSTGEVMGIADDFPTAFGKAQAAAGVSLPTSGTVFITVTDTDKAAATQLAARFHDLGFEIIATRGTAQAISRMGIPVQAINKIGEGSPHVVDFIRNGEVDMVINTPTGSGARSDGYEIRSAAVQRGHPLHHDDDRRLGGARAIVATRDGGAEPISLQELHGSELRSTEQAGEPVDDRPRPGAVRPAQRARSSPTRRPAATGSSRRSTATGPSRAAGQFYMLATDRLGRGPAAARTCRAPSRSPPPRPPTMASGSASCSRRSARAPSALAALARGETLHRHRPARQARSRRPASSRPDAAGAILVGGGIGIAPLAILRRELAARGVPQRVLLGLSRSRATPAASSCFGARRCGPRPRTATPATRATSPTCSR